MERVVLLSAALILSATSLGFICVSLAGFSLNKDIIQNTYWAEANLPKLVINNPDDDYRINDYNIVQLYGLRLVVNVCDGKHCNDNGDDFSEPVESNRIQNCYDNDDNDAQDTCFKCRDAGLASGSMIIFAFVFMLAAIGLTGIRFSDERDKDVFRFAGIGMHGAVMFFSFLALTIYGAQCYQNLVDNLYDNWGDDYITIDHDDIKFSLGPGFSVLLVAMLVQPISMVLLFLVPVGAQPGGAAKGSMSSAGGASSSI